MVDTIGMADAVTGAPSYNGRMLRQLGAVGFAGATAARPLGARSGVRPGTPSNTVTATSTTWTCQPFAGLLDGQTAVEAGPYALAFDAVAAGAITAASASIARVDLIYVQVDDPSESDGSSVPAVTRKYLAGTVASTAPATPARSMVVAHINVPISGGGSPTVTWVAPYLAAAGGVVHFRNATERDAETSLPSGALGEVLGVIYRWDGTVWGALTPPGVFLVTRQAFSGNSVAIDSLFDASLADDYDVVVDLSSVTANTNISCIMRTSGADYTTANHVTGNMLFNTAPAFSVARSTTATAFGAGRGDSGGGGGGSKFTLLAPNSARYTRIMGNGIDAAIMQSFFGQIPNTTLFTGMKIKLDGAITGVGFVTVYALRKV